MKTDLLTLTIVLYSVIFAISLLCAYLVGSIPTGYWLTKWLKGIDIRQVGSGSTGATNVYRNVGKVAGVSVFIIDFLKGYLPVVLIIWISPLMCLVKPANGGFCIDVNEDPYYLLPVLTAAAALIGHSRSIFLGFKGGKSAATGLGTLFALDPAVGALTFSSWMIVLYFSKMVSLSSILATAMCIPLMFFLHRTPSYVVYCVLGFIYVTVRHKDNIGRILAGTEPKVGAASKSTSKG